MIGPALALLLAAAVAPAAPAVLTVVSGKGERRVPVVTERGFPAVAVPALAAALALEATAAPPGTVALRVQGHAFDFVLDAGYFRFDGRIFTLAAGPYMGRDTVFVPLQWVVEYLPRLMAGQYRYDAARSRLEETPQAATAAAAPAPRAGRRRVVAIDPGHGGVDPGMHGPMGRRITLHEKEVTFAIARQLARELEGRGIGTVLTRTRDTLIARSDRGRIAAREGADVFVSIHVNAANPRWRNGADVRGFETYFLGEALTEDARRVSRMEESVVRFETSATAEPGDPLAFILADLAQNEHLRESGRLAELVHGALGRVHPAVDRGVKQAPFTVLVTSYMPAILIETGFGSNEAEARYLTSERGQRALARAIADGVAAYLAEYERRVNAP